jgi:hypothetical protein
MALPVGSMRSDHGSDHPTEEFAMTALRLPTADATAVTRPGIEPAVITFVASEVSLVPVRRDGRVVGAYVSSGGNVRFRPVVDVRQALSAAAGVAVVAVAGATYVAARRRAPAVGAVTMGPGGWISFKGVTAPALRPADDRPWWARLLRAHRLVVR